MFLPSVKLPHSISCISGVLELHKSKAGRISCHPHAPQGTIIAKCSLQLSFVTTVAQIANIDLTIQWAVPAQGRVCRGKKKFSLKYYHHSVFLGAICLSHLFKHTKTDHSWSAGQKNVIKIYLPYLHQTQTQLHT